MTADFYIKSNISDLGDLINQSKSITFQFQIIDNHQLGHFVVLHSADHRVLLSVSRMPVEESRKNTGGCNPTTMIFELLPLFIVRLLVCHFRSYAICNVLPQLSNLHKCRTINESMFQ